jgi:excisionase family DNA binding protein
MDRRLTDALRAGEHPEQLAAREHLTVDSIKWRIKQLGLSTRDGWRSREEIASVLGVGRRAVNRWMQAGLLRVTRHGTRWTRVSTGDLETFVSAQAGLLFDPADVTDPQLRRLAEVAATANHRREAV